VSEESKDGDRHAFGKPVWDFKYPESSFFITEGELFGCSISTTRPEDMVCAALGSTYPFVLRPDGDHFLIRGYAFVHGIMLGEQQDSEGEAFKAYWRALRVREKEGEKREGRKEGSCFFS
jgi:hypothetical protein